MLEPQSLLTAVDALYECSSYTQMATSEFFKGWPSSLPGFIWNKRQYQTQLEDAEMPPMATLAFIVFMIFNIASIIKVRRRVYASSPERYYLAAMAFAPDCFSQTSLYSIQALVMLIIHCIHTPADANLWTLIHLGMSHCIELGLHRDHAEDEKDIRELKQFVFYTMYGLDR